MKFAMESFDSFTFQMEFDGERKKVTAKPHPEPLKDGKPISFEISINNFPRGKIRLNDNEWHSPDIINEKLVEAIGKHLSDHYNR